MRARIVTEEFKGGVVIRKVYWDAGVLVPFLSFCLISCK